MPGLQRRLAQRRGLVGHRTAAAEQPARCASKRRPPHHQRDRPCPAVGLPLARLSQRLRALHDRLQPLQSLVTTRDLAAHLPDRGRPGPHRRHRGAGQHLREGPPLGRRRPKKASQDQAIGISRGGRSTKLHLIADLLGRPIVLGLTPGHHAHVRAAPDLMAAAGPFRRLIADRAYDADRFRASLREAGAIPVIPAAATEPSRSATTGAATASVGGSKPPSAASRTSAASPPATTRSSAPSSTPSTIVAIYAFWL